MHSTTMSACSLIQDSRSISKKVTHSRILCGFTLLRFSAGFSAYFAILLAATAATLKWDPSGTSASFTGTNWWDGTTLVAPGGVTAFNDLTFAGAGTNSKDGPINMTISGSTSFTSLTYNNNFNPTNTTTLSSTNSSGSAILHVASGGSIIDSASSGTVTFMQGAAGAFKFDLHGSATLNVAQGASMVFGSGILIEDAMGSTGSIQKTFGGTLTLASANKYGGGTTVSGGTLLVANTTGSATGTGTVAVNNSGTLGGTGLITGAVTIATNGTLSPGLAGAAGSAAAVGTLHTGALTLQSGSFSNFDVSGTSTYDELISSGAIAFGGTLDVNIASGLHFTSGQTLSLFSGSSETGTFSGIADNQLVTFDGYTFVADYTGTGFTLTAVPEPSTWATGAFALLAIGFTQRRRFQPQSERVRG